MIGEILGDMTLGAVVTTDLEISNAVITAANVTPSVRPENGLLALDICEEGGPRLITKSGSLAIVARQTLQPNRSEIVADTYERGQHQIDIVTLTGDVVATYAFVRGADATPRSFAVDVRALASGTYQIILQTPTRRRVLPLSILH